MFRVSDYLTSANRRRKTDRDVFEEVPITSVFFYSSDKVGRPHSHAGIELALVCAFDPQLYVGDADIDAGSLGHRLANTSELLAETDHLTEALENALLFLSGCAATRPAFNNFKGEEPEKRHAREFQIEPQIFCDLFDRTHAVELGCELRLGDGEPQVLHSLKSVAGVSRNGGGIMISAVPKLRKLNEAQGRQSPLIDIELSRERSGEVRKRSLIK